MTAALNNEQPQSLLLTSLEHSVWHGVHSDLEIALGRLKLAHLSSPSMLILHDLIECAVRAMHRGVFLNLAEVDFGMGENDHTNLDALYKAELAEHGTQNIANYCAENKHHVAISFPLAGNDIVLIHTPVKWDRSILKTAKLIEALGYELQESLQDDLAEGSMLILKKHPHKTATVQAGRLLEAEASLGSVQHIYEKLGYGIIQFTSAGEVIAVSRSMLASAKLAVEHASIGTLSAAIPYNFYNDIIWGLALTGENGVFENYRIRMRLSGDENVSILFNVSGYRDQHAVVHSLWQIVSLADGGASLAEGSILSDARVNKITRNYVPQLVEEKAREAVRLGKDKLTNEECFVAVLFCDIVGFTSYVESNASSESIINTLNSILRRVSSSVNRFHGAIDKFMGDSVMAIFKDPANALKAAQDMQSHSDDINSLRTRAGQETLRLRIGIHWGEVVIGNVGTAERLDWTAIGDVVNTASRIEKNCHPGSILISEILRKAIPPMQYSKFRFGEMFHLTVKGKREALAVCHIKHPDEK